MVLSAVAFADVSGCGVKASIAGVDEGTAGDQVSGVPLAHEVSRGLPGLHWVCFVTCFGDRGAAAFGLRSSLMSLVLGGAESSGVVLHPGRLDWFEGRVGKGRWCHPVLGGSAAAGPGTGGGYLPITGTVTRKSKSALNFHHSLTAQGLVCIAAWVGGYLG